MEAIVTRRVSKGIKGAELLADIEVVGSAVTQVDITGLNITSDDEILLVSDIVCSANSDYNLFVNGNDTATNYYRQRLTADSTSKTASRTNNSVISSCVNGMKSLINTVIKLTESGYFTHQSSEVGEYGGSTVDLENNYASATFTESSITSIKISGSTNSIGIGSRFQLYKLGGA